MSDANYGVVPGFQSKNESVPVQLTWSGRQGNDLAATRKVVIGSTAVDAGNSPTTTLRAGLVYPYVASANDGRQIPIGILEREINMLEDGTATDRFTHMLVQGMVRENRILGLDPFAKSQLATAFLFDQEASNQGKLGNTPRGVRTVAADYTVTAADQGLLLSATAAVNFTLPTKQPGLAFRFLQTANARMQILGNADVVFGGSVGYSTLDFNTTGQKLGSHVIVECLYAKPNTLLWVVSNLGGTTITLS
jgi:hypothetical protein